MTHLKPIFPVMETLTEDLPPRIHCSFYPRIHNSIAKSFRKRWRARIETFTPWMEVKNTGCNIEEILLCPGNFKWRFAALRFVHSQDTREIRGPNAFKTRLRCTCHEIALSVSRQTCTWNRVICHYLPDQSPNRCNNWHQMGLECLSEKFGEWSAGPKRGCLNVGAWNPQESGRKAPLSCNAAFSILHCSFSPGAAQLLVNMTSALQKSHCCSATSAAQHSENCSATSDFACGILQGWGLEGWGLGLAEMKVLPTRLSDIGDCGLDNTILVHCILSYSVARLVWA